MARVIAHPKKTEFCAFCKRWSGEAALVIKPPNIGIVFETQAQGQCLFKGGLRRAGTVESGCRYFAPCVEADKLL